MDQLSLGEALRDAGMSRAEQAESDEWNAACDAAIAWWAKTGEEFTAEEVRKRVGDPKHPNAMGPRFAAAARAGLIVRVGYARSPRPSLHAHPTALWKGASA
jgi:hypothetical protein